MKKQSSLLFFSIFLLVSICTWFLLFQSLDTPNRISKISLKLEKIRTLGIEENPVEIRRAVEIPDGIKDDMREIVDRLNMGLQDKSKSFSESELIETIKIMGSYGERASFASSAILKLIEYSTVSKDVNSVYFQGLLALVRITKSPESTESTIREKCLDAKGLEGGASFACLALLRLGLNLPKVMEDDLSKSVTTLFNEDSKTIKSWLENGGIVIENVDSVLNPLCLYSPLLKDGQLERSTQAIVSIIQSNLSSHIKISALNCAIDMAEKYPELLNIISHTMQFASDKSLRREALLTLLHIGSDRSLELAKAYGHKFINGEAPPEIITPHPFRQWAIDSVLKKSPAP